MKKNLLTGAAILTLAAFSLFGCSNNKASSGTDSTQQSEPAEVTMNYITKEDLKADIDAGNNGYTILDVRKAEDYNTAHIVGAFSGDVDAAINGEDHDTAKASLQAGLKDATGSENGNNDSKYVLVCYSGKRYAQQATQYMIDLGIDQANILTLEGGMTGWSEAGDDYTALVE